MKDFDINKFQKENRYNAGHAMMVKVIECNDGALLSIQASNFHYCQPRKDLINHYESFEVAELKGGKFVKSAFLDNLKLGGDDDVYGWIHYEVVNKLINYHGGLKQSLTHKEVWDM